MRLCRRIGALVLSTLVLGALVAVPAQAQSPETFAGRAQAHALQITLAGTDVTVGGTEAQADSTPSAQANGAGVALLGGTVSQAQVSGAGQSDTPPEACLLNLPLLQLLNVALACSESQASTTPEGAPNADSKARVASVDLNGLTLLQPIIDSLTPLLSQTIGTVTATLDQLLGGLLNPLLGNLNLSLDSLVQDLLDGLERATGILGISVGSSHSSVTTDSGAVTAMGTAQGAQIDLLPGLTLGGDPLVSIIVGDATSTSTYDRATGQSTPSFDPAIVRVRLGLPLLGGTITEIPVTLGAPLVLLQGTPLEISISLGAGRNVTNDDGTVGSVADGVSIHLLNSLIGIDLAHAESAVGGVQAISTTAEVLSTPVQEVQELARTGGSPGGGPGLGWLPMAGFGLLLAGFVARRLAVAGRRP